MSAPRSIWKGHISVGLVLIPVRVYNAVDTSEKISFNEIHDKCGGRVGRDKPCKKCGKTLESADIVKGFQYAPDEYVIIEKGDLDNLKLKSTRVVDVQGFVPADSINMMAIDAPYYVAPDGAVAQGAYDLIVAALRKRKVAGVGKIVLRDREDVVAISAHNEGLLMLKLRQPNEVRKIEDTPLVSAKPAKIGKAQMDLALSLVDGMAATMDDLDLNDRYREALKDLVEAKVNKREIVLVATNQSRVTATADINDVLRASIAQSRKKKAVG